jgi:hypothetical protein
MVARGSFSFARDCLPAARSTIFRITHMRFESFLAGPRLPDLEKAIPSESPPYEFPGLRRRPLRSLAISGLPVVPRSAGPIRCGLAIFVTGLCSAVVGRARLDSPQLLAVLRRLVAPGRYSSEVPTSGPVTKGKRVRTLSRVRTLRFCSSSLDAQTYCLCRALFPLCQTTRLAGERCPLLPRAPGAAPGIRRTSRSSTYGR